MLHAEPMNLDDFIVADNIGTPSSEATKAADEKSGNAVTSAAIPIKARKESSQHFIPQSVPAHPHQRVPDEFGLSNPST